MLRASGIPVRRCYCRAGYAPAGERQSADFSAMARAIVNYIMAGRAPMAVASMGYHLKWSSHSAQTENDTTRHRRPSSDH